MKVLFLIDSNIGTIGGAQNSVKTLIRVLSKKGIQTGVYMPSASTNINKKSEKIANYVFFHRTKGHHTKVNQLFVEIFSLKSCIKQFRPNVIHAQSAHIAIVLGIMKMLRLVPKSTKIFLTDRGYLPEYNRKVFVGLKIVANVYDIIITTTERNKMEWIKYFSCKNITCISNVLDNDWFIYSKPNQDSIRQSLGLNKKIYIGFSGRYEEYKRWDTVADICKSLKSYKNIHFVVAITADNGIFREEMQKYIKMLKLTFNKDKMTIIVDANREEMKEFYDLIDIFILTSRNESFGRTLIEAMARNSIVIGTNSGGVPEVINDENYLFEVGDTSGAISIIKRFIDNPKLIPIEKRKFFNFAQKKYREHTLLKRHMELYNGVANG